MASQDGEVLADETAHLSLVDTQQTVRPDQIRPPDARDPPRITTLDVNAKDITARFTSAASKLETGQLVKDEFFTLFESVGALEIMDSKMDSGYLGPGETLDDDYDVLREILPDEVVGIMDQLFCHEMAWHMGHPLSQTLFTSIYIDRLLWPEPKELGQATFSRAPEADRGGPWVHIVLRAYCLGLIKSCDFVHTRIACEQFYEEEDFVTHLYNRNLFSVFSTKDIMDNLQEAVEFLMDVKINTELERAIVSRLRFRTHLLSALSKGIDVIDDPDPKDWGLCLAMIPEITTTRHLGKPVEESFSLKIQRKLASSVPPRPMVKISFEDALAQLKRLCQDAIDVLQILDYRGSTNLMASVWTLQSRRPQSSVYIRSLIQSLVFFDMKALGFLSIKQLLFDDLSEIVLPESQLLDPSYEDVELPTDPRYHIAKLMDEFLQKMAQPYIDIFRTACLNRSRVRRTLCHTVLDWDSLQIDAEELDTTIRNITNEVPLTLTHTPPGTESFSLPLSSWTYHHKLNLLRYILQLGFELSICAPDELAGMYWYLSHIAQTHILHLDRIKAFSSRDMPKPPKTSKSKSVHLPASHHISPELSRSLTYLHNTRLQLSATVALSSAIHALYILLKRHSLIPTPPRPYSSDTLRYELRMKPFLPVTLPELVPFDEFSREVSCPGASDAKLASYAASNVAEARKSWDEILKTCRPPPLSEEGAGEDVVGREWERDVKDVIRACIGASIAISTVAKALDAKRMGKLKVEVPAAGEKGNWHVWWIVPKVVGG